MNSTKQSTSNNYKYKTNPNSHVYQPALLGSNHRHSLMAYDQKQKQHNHSNDYEDDYYSYSLGTYTTNDENESERPSDYDNFNDSSFAETDTELNRKVTNHNHYLNSLIPKQVKTLRKRDESYDNVNQNRFNGKEILLITK